MPRAQYRKRHGTEAASQRIGGVQTRKSRLTFDRSPVRESRTPGSVRGDRGNPVPYRVNRVNLQYDQKESRLTFSRIIVSPRGLITNQCYVRACDGSRFTLRRFTDVAVFEGD
jgi:hypothetical protein